MSVTLTSENTNGDLPAGARRAPLGGPRPLGQHARQIRRDAAALAGEVRSATDDLDRYLTDRVVMSPYSTLGAAAGIGYVLGGGLGSRLTVALLGIATRLATAVIAREVALRISQRDAPSVGRHSA